MIGLRPNRNNWYRATYIDCVCCCRLYAPSAKKPTNLNRSLISYCIQPLVYMYVNKIIRYQCTYTSYILERLRLNYHQSPPTYATLYRYRFRLKSSIQLSSCLLSLSCYTQTGLHLSLQDSQILIGFIPKPSFNRLPLGGSTIKMIVLLHSSSVDWVIIGNNREFKYPIRAERVRLQIITTARTNDKS